MEESIIGSTFRKRNRSLINVAPLILITSRSYDDSSVKKRTSAGMSIENKDGRKSFTTGLILSRTDSMKRVC